MSRDPAGPPFDLATTRDIRAVLGALNESDLLEIVALRPTIRDIEETATWLSGDRDIYGAGEPLKGVVAEIVAVLTPAEEDEAPRTR
jgi:hypothetical protein